MTSLTLGIHHVGLAVSRLEESARFFIDVLGWQEVKRKPDYPAVFVSDGVVMLTLWATQVDDPIEFDRKRNVGLHHLALRVDSKQALHNVHERLVEAQVPIEFGPEAVGDGPAYHLMCYEPSGVRIEIIWPGL